MFTLAGVDIFLQTDQIPDVPKEHGPLKLVMMMNRGMRVWPGEPPQMHFLDLTRLRYEGEGVTSEHIESLLSELSKMGFVWAKAQKLFTEDGEKKYSQPY
jgi:hypothetical protein